LSLNFEVEDRFIGNVCSIWIQLEGAECEFAEVEFMAILECGGLPPLLRPKVRRQTVVLKSGVKRGFPGGQKPPSRSRYLLSYRTFFAR
jgi:hypothetical protein